MKKTLQISIAKTPFTIEEDAYNVLDRYLSSVKDHFADVRGKDEIITDIESRIAEQLLETKEKVIELAHVEAVLGRMGKVEDFDDADTTRHKEDVSAADTGRVGYTKKLYRNPDNTLIAGVCSGFAAYLGVDPVWVRLTFILLLLANGFGLLLYIIFWIITPEAKTKAQKLEMRGNPVTLETLSDTVRERVEEVKENKSGGWGRIIRFPFQLIGTILAGLLRIIGPVVRYGGGAILMLTSLVILVSLMVTSGFLLSDSTWISYDVPVTQFLPGYLHWVILAAGTVAILVPALFILIAGISLFQKKTIISGAVGLGLLGIWFVALMISGFGVAKIAERYQDFIATSPSYQETTRPLSVEGTFEKLELTNGIHVEVVTGTSTSLVAEGRAKDIDSVVTKLESGVLKIERRETPEVHFCIFCFSETPNLTLTVPSLLAVSARNGSRLHSNDFPELDALTVTLDNGSTAELVLDVDTLTAEVKDGSWLSLKGMGETLTATMEHASTLRARKFSVTNAKIMAINGSSAEVNATDSIEATAESGSRVFYVGSPEVTIQNRTRGSTVESFDTRYVEPTDPSFESFD